MDFNVSSIIRSTLGVYAGACLLFSAAMADNLPDTGKIKLNSVPVYSRADIYSDKVKAINRKEAYYIKTVLDNGTDRWCAIVNNRNVFVGYVLCDQLKAQKSRPPRAKHVKPVAKRTVTGKSPVMTPPDKAQNRIKPDADRRGFAAVTSSKGKAVDATRRAGKDTGAVKHKKYHLRIVLLTFAAVFIALGLIAYLIYGLTMRNVLRRKYFKPIEYRETDSVDETDASTAGSTMLHETTGEHVAVGRTEGEESGGGKAEAPPVGTLVKCQSCGTVQILEIDAKCINCRGAIPKDIHRIDPE